MAQSIFRHRPGRTRAIPRWNVDSVSRAMAGAWRPIGATYRRDPRLFLWNLLWLPFWLGSEAPPPALPGVRRAQAAATLEDAAGTYLASRVDRITRRFTLAWLAGALLRGLTLALLIVAIWVGLALFGVAGLPSTTAVGGLVVVGMLAGGVYAWLARPDRLMVARMFDRTFVLQERIVTAFDRPIDGRHVSRLQLADAANTLDEIVTEIPRSTFLPVREAAICLIVGGALVTLLLAYVPRDAIAAVADSPVPQFVPASERLAARDEAPPPPPLAEQPEAERASIAEIQERGRQSQSAREDLARIGDALRNHPVTQPAAELIASGDYATAADSLRAASESAATMDQESRDALADDLDAAAQAVSAENPELAQAASDAAAALREGGPEAESALGGLADQVEETGSQVESQDDLARDLDEAQSGASDSGTSSGEGSEGEGSSPSESQSSGEGGAGQGQQASDPGEGASAQPGVSDQPQESAGSSSSSGSSQGSSQEGSGDSSEGAGESAESQQGEGSGEPSSSGEGSAGDGSSGDQQGLQGAPDDETSASQGSGAGTGQSGANDQNTSDDAVDAPSNPGENPEAEAPGVGEAGDPPPSRAERGEEDDATGTASQGSTNLQLEGVSDSGVQTGGDSGSSSLGSGSGSTTASGDQTAGNVGVAGPDSNRVPDALRDVVQDYFGGPEE